MFSEYASKFLAQSGSTLSMGFADRNPLARNPRDRQRDTRSSRYQSRGLYSDRRPLQNPYAQNQGMGSRFGFGSRTSQAPAPLFHSTLDDFREEDDAEEHAHNVAEYYALQRSRRQVGASQLTQSSEGSDGGQPLREEEEEEDSSYERGRGIRSSWKGESVHKSLKPPTVGTVRESASRDRSDRGSDESSKGKGKLVDVELESSRRDSEDDMDKIEASDDYEDEDPPSVQQLRTPIPKKQQHSWIPEETDEETAMSRPRPPSPDRESVPPSLAGETVLKAPMHDAFFASLYTLMMAALVGSFVLSYLHNSTPDKKHPLGDTVYSTLRKSFHLLGIDTLVAVIVAVLWLGVVRSALRPLVYMIILGVPIVLTSFAIYPLVESFRGFDDGASLQDKFMRFTSFLPAIAAVFWSIMTYRSRHAISRATDILSFSVKILETSPTLILVGFSTLVANVFWTWTWILMFRRIFLGGHYTSSSKSRLLFIVDIGTWWLGAFFILMFLWTQSIISGVQRATTAATVSQWYFHRNSIPAPSSRAVVTESIKHALTILFGTICASTFFQLAVRLPLLILPRRIVALITIFIYNFFPTPIASLTNPLTLTYAAIHSEPLGRAARGLSNLSFVSTTSPTTTLTPSSASNYAPLLPYRLSKLLLHATRYVTAFCLGIAGWVSTSHTLQFQSMGGGKDKGGIYGSLYAYVVGLLAGAIGWSILGAMEGVVGGVVDAVAVCWGTEVAARGTRGGKAPERGGYCWEAADLFGEGGR